MRPYEPATLPVVNLDYQMLFAVVGNANAELARYDGLLQGIVNPSVMLSPLTNEEAVLSSKIEGTQAKVDEVLEREAGLLKEGEKFKDIQEIVNYREALRSAHYYLEERPLSLSFVR
jgi:Fic family protein